MDFIFDYISVRTFWRILLFFHFVLAVALLLAVTLQSVAVLMPVRQAAGNFIQRVRAAPPAWYVPLIVILYVINFLLGAWVYVKYRTYVRIPMEQLGHWWTVGSFEFKEHVAILDVDPRSEEHTSELQSLRHLVCRLLLEKKKNK